MLRSPKTPQTLITSTLIDDITDRVTPLVMKPSLHEIDAAGVKTSSNCPFCNCTVSYNKEILTFKCNGCNKKMLTSKIIKSFYCHSQFKRLQSTRKCNQ